MTTAGSILNEFFSPFSSEKLWIMPQNDGYTKTVLTWIPVTNAVNRTKSDLIKNCLTWQSNYKSKPSWKPTKTDVPKSGAYRDFVPSPPGTDPTTCGIAFAAYTASIATKSFFPGGHNIPPVQTKNLYTCSIGSFNIYTTVDDIDCTKKTATMNFWMYNRMSKRSFGKFAKNPAFVASGMKSQYMWWNWVEKVDWSSGTMKTLPSAPVKNNW